MDELLQEFIAETRETLEAIAGEIVAWEADPSARDRLDSIFRFVHTVKGSCGFLDLPRLERLSHAAEGALAAVRDGRRVADRPLVDAVLAIADRIGEIVEAIDAGTSLDDSAEDLLIAALDEQPAHTLAPVAQTIAQAVALAPRAPTRSVRLSVDLLDRMMSGMSEMVLARNDLARRVREEGGDATVQAALERLSLTVAEMRDTVTRTRMQKIEALFSPLPRLVRDTAASVGKQVALSIDGADVELDREMIEMMRDPLVHMVRNSIDHGLETPAERVSAGKREAGRLTVSARQSGNRIIVEIADDGRGIDTDRLVAKLIAQDPAREPELRRLGERGRLDLIFEPGLSTRDQVTALSGRGVGMDVVRANVEQIGGRIELDNRPGAGLAVSIEVPLTLAILSAVVVSVGEQSFAIPRQAIEEIVALRGAGVRVDRLGDAWVVTIRDRRLPLVDLADLMGVPGGAEGAAMVAVVNFAGGTFALAIDRIVDTEELVVKPAAPAVMAAGVFAGQTLPDNGVPLMLLDCTGIAGVAGLRFDRVPEPEAAAEQPTADALALLLFEDCGGERRAIALSAIDRVESVAAGAIALSAGRLRLVAGDHVVPVVATGPLPHHGNVSVIRLEDARGDIGYAIRAAIDIIDCAAPVTPIDGGMIAGVTVLDGEPVEILDPLWILDQRDRAAEDRRPLCLLRGEDAGWMAAFLAPTLEAAGYRTATALPPGASADVILAMEDDAAPAEGGALVRLSRDRDHGVYCYDRRALIAAIAARTGAHA